MANITEQHLHHMAKRHHSTMRKLDALKDKFAGVTQRVVGTLEVAAGAGLGGLIEGRTDGQTVLHVPINLGLGALVLVGAHLDLAGAQWQDHLNNLGNGLVASYVASASYSFGKRWRETGKFLPGKGEALGTQVKGEISQGQMDEIVRRMQQVATPAG